MRCDEWSGATGGRGQLRLLTVLSLRVLRQCTLSPSVRAFPPPRRMQHAEVPGGRRAGWHRVHHANRGVALSAESRNERRSGDVKGGRRNTDGGDTCPPSEGQTRCVRTSRADVDGSSSSLPWAQPPAGVPPMLSHRAHSSEREREWGEHRRERQRDIRMQLCLPARCP